MSTPSKRKQAKAAAADAEQDVREAVQNASDAVKAKTHEVADNLRERAEDLQVKAREKGDELQAQARAQGDKLQAQARSSVDIVLGECVSALSACLASAYIQCRAALTLSAALSSLMRSLLSLRLQFGSFASRPSLQSLARISPERWLLLNVMTYRKHSYLSRYQS